MVEIGWRTAVASRERRVLGMLGVLGVKGVDRMGTGVVQGSRGWVRNVPMDRSGRMGDFRDLF